MRKHNLLGYLSLIGLFGFLGFFTEHNALYIFFGFFGYAYYFKVIPDEMFKEHVRKASAASFFLVLTALTIIIVLTSVTRNMNFVYWGSFSTYILANLSFATIHTIYEIKEHSGSNEIL